MGASDGGWRWGVTLALGSCFFIRAGVGCWIDRIRAQLLSEGDIETDTP